MKPECTVSDLCVYLGGTESNKCGYAVIDTVQMSEFKMVFKRYELKYLLDENQYQAVKSVLDEHMRMDEYGRSEIRNVYYDTDDFLLIRRSIERPLYKEKLRFRSYGRPRRDGKIFVELKKKYDGVVYKRRLNMPLDRAVKWFSDPESTPPEGQIGAEIDFMRHRYQGIRPMMNVNYEREAFFTDDSDFRVTLDYSVRAGIDDVGLRSRDTDFNVLPEGYTLMELKTMGGIPLWMTRVLSENRIYRTSFSKYGNAYRLMVLGKEPEIYTALSMRDSIMERLSRECSL